MHIYQYMHCRCNCTSVVVGDVVEFGLVILVAAIDAVSVVFAFIVSTHSHTESQAAGNLSR